MRSVSNPPDYSRRQEEERTGVEIASKVLGKNNKPGHAPFYTGDSPGFGAVFDICSPSEQPLSRHIMLTSKTSASLSPEDKAYLQYKGVFNMPRKETCDELLQAYFHHVHPIMPHLKAETWQSEGFSSRKAMKETMYSRAKCLHNNGGETDHTVLLQSALLLGFYHSEADTYTQPWFWLGVAISLCQTMGLHRFSAAVCASSPITESQQRLWRRLWWTCFFRDRWLSLTMGRPLRININDCNTVQPSANDMLNDFAELPESITAAYVPKDLPQLAEYWVMIIQLTQLLGESLTLCYQPFGNTSSFQQVEALEQKVLRFQLPEYQETGQSPLATFYLYHLQLHYQAFVITFYRPFITKDPEGLPASRQEAWRAHVRNQINAAALQTNAILDNLAHEKLLEYSGPMTPPLIVPAMHVHLLNCKSSDPVSRRLGLNKIEVCMIVLEQMQHTHPCSSVFRVLPDFASKSSPPQDDSADDPLAGITIDENAIDALMDEVSIFNFWESLNNMQT
ncbi:Transcription factor [Penicillium coprophilum]|uniref:Transcription factor n=1 Tax=Penicillium coprophilum TaxID=36646 RepID=UPI0023961E9B|nr:Transcription factor [Penicillium coprophilum]KAJ5178047.1 Transcription factor [Penicillium coprophilum]